MHDYYLNRFFPASAYAVVAKEARPRLIEVVAVNGLAVSSMNDADRAALATSEDNARYLFLVKGADDLEDASLHLDQLIKSL